MSEVGQIKFVYFDVGQVLVSMKAGFESFSKENGFSEKEKERFDQVWGKYSSQLCKGSVTSEWFRQKFREEAGLKLADWFDVRSMTVERFEPIPQMSALVVDVARKYQVGLLSNAYEGMIKDLIERGKLPKVDYEVIVDSFEEKMVKPDREIYELATEKAGVLPSEIFFIDDGERNIAAADNYGWQTFVFDEDMVAEQVEELRGILF